MDYLLRFYFLLSEKQMDHPQPTVPSMTTCPTGWKPVNGQCYLPAPIGTKYTWMEAEQVCQDAGRQIQTSPGLTYAGHLTSVHSVEQQNQLSVQLRSTSTWIGLRVIGNRLFFWIYEIYDVLYGIGFFEYVTTTFL